MADDRGSELPADGSRGEPGSEAIALTEGAQRYNSHTFVPSRAAAGAAEKLASGAASFLWSFVWCEAKPELVDAARQRLKLAIEQLDEICTLDRELLDRYRREREMIAARVPSPDERAGMNWWNALSESERGEWLTRYPTAAGAWDWNKRLSNTRAFDHFCPHCDAPCNCTRWSNIGNCEHECGGAG